MTICLTVSPQHLERFTARLSTFVLHRDGASLTIDLPLMVATTSRGVVQHLSRDHVAETNAVRWLHVPFESFLETTPPIPTLQTGQHPLHTFFGYPSSSVVSLTLRIPSDNRVLPPNGKNFVSAYCLQGVRQITPTNWKSYVSFCKPDFAVALSDVPSTGPSYSQKRITKSIERSATWLAHFLTPAGAYLPHVLVHMSGGTSIPARRAFADSLLEKLEEKEAEAMKPHNCLNDGVAGYVFELASLIQSLAAETEPSDQKPKTSQLIPLIQASLSSLPSNKLRFVNSARSPHEILRLIQHVGIDLFDSHWAQRAADIGVALDFNFPAQDRGSHKKRKNGKRDVGHNLYDTCYAQDFSPLAACFRGRANNDAVAALEVCDCLACSPKAPNAIIAHSSADTIELHDADPKYLAPFTRAYLHHLLHTHEMSAHTLLTMHNLTVLDIMFTKIRSTIKEFGVEEFAAQADKFGAEYDEDLEILEEARIMWEQVDLARGKGRLAREKKVQVEE